MLKNILKLNGAQELSKIEQKSVLGGTGSVCASTQSECDNQCSGVCIQAFCGPYGSAPGSGFGYNWVCFTISPKK